MHYIVNRIMLDLAVSNMRVNNFQVFELQDTSMVKSLLKKIVKLQSNGLWCFILFLTSNTSLGTNSAQRWVSIGLFSTNWPYVFLMMVSWHFLKLV